MYLCGELDFTGSVWVSRFSPIWDRTMEEQGEGKERERRQRRELAGDRRNRCRGCVLGTGEFEAYYWTIAGCHASLRGLIII